MAQNITLLGASYSAVPSVILPKTGGGTASFTDVSDTTAAASDVASGKYFYTAAGVRTQGTSSGGGGGANIEALSITQNGTYTASSGVDGYSPVTVNVSGGGLTSVVRGSFRYASEGWQTISVSYSGTGYPIGLAIFIKNGISDSTYSQTVRRYAISEFYVSKNYNKVAPTYSGDGSISLYRYKNSSSDPTNNNGGNNTTSVYSTSESTYNSAGYAVRISGDKQIKVRMVNISENTSRYGFLVSTDYEYIVIYSS